MKIVDDLPVVPPTKNVLVQELRKMKVGQCLIAPEIDRSTAHNAVNPRLRSRKNPFDGIFVVRSIRGVTHIWRVD